MSDLLCCNAHISATVPNGFPVEWYNTFLDFLAPKQYQLYNEMFETGSFRSSVYAKHNS